MRGGYDAVVVGMGPAGAAAALELARGGARVVVAGGRPRRPKPCGGCLSARARAVLEALGVWEHLGATQVNRLWLGAVSTKDVVDLPAAEGSAWFVDRARLEEVLGGALEKEGVEVRAWKARGMEGAVVVGEGGRVRAGWVVACDGAAGAFSKSLGLGRAGWSFVGLVEEIPGEAPGMAPGLAVIELGAAVGGYGWVFVREGVVNAGVAGAMGAYRARPGTLRAHFQRFLRRWGLASRGRARGGIVPCVGLRRPRVVAGRVIAAGDAAALADPLLGEGIAQALASGRAAARAALNSDPGAYLEWLRLGLLRDHDHARALARGVYRLPSLAWALARARPGAVELGWAWLGGRLRLGQVWTAGVKGLVGIRPELDRPVAAYYSDPGYFRQEGP